MRHKKTQLRKTGRSVYWFFWKIIFKKEGLLNKYKYYEYRFWPFFLLLEGVCFGSFETADRCETENNSIVVIEGEEKFLSLDPYNQGGCLEVFDPKKNPLISEEEVEQLADPMSRLNLT